MPVKRKSSKKVPAKKSVSLVDKARNAFESTKKECELAACAVDKHAEKFLATLSSEVDKATVTFKKLTQKKDAAAATFVKATDRTRAAAKSALALAESAVKAAANTLSALNLELTALKGHLKKQAASLKARVAFEKEWDKNEKAQKAAKKAAVVASVPAKPAKVEAKKSPLKKTKPAQAPKKVNAPFASKTVAPSILAHDIAKQVIVPEEELVTTDED